MNGESILETQADRVVEKYQKIQSQLATHLRQNPHIVVVTKNQPIQLIKQLMTRLPRLIFGENRVQESLPKIEACGASREGSEWHFIGILQRNKVKKILGKFTLLQSLDRLSLAEEIEKWAVRKEIQHVKCLLQLDISQNGSKTGINPEIRAIKEFLQNCEGFPRIQIEGLMTIVPWLPAEKTRPYFQRMAQLFRTLQGEPLPSNVSMKTLSMGMSNDYHVAVEEGATMVRLGTALFGT